MTNKLNSIFAIGILMLISMACNFSFSTRKRYRAPSLLFGIVEDIFLVANLLSQPGQIIFKHLEGFRHVDHLQ